MKGIGVTGREMVKGEGEGVRGKAQGSRGNG
jgi:hypothetical protein